MTRKRLTGIARIEERAPSICPHDGAMLDADGFCGLGRGYPYLEYREVKLEDGQVDVRLIGRSCPFVCPLCRGPLDWSGGCERCHGATTGRREDWTFPGDRYDRWDDTGKAIGDNSHWVKTDGPRPACSVAQNKAALNVVKAVLGGLPVARAHQRLAKIFDRPS